MDATYTKRPLSDDGLISVVDGQSEKRRVLQAEPRQIVSSTIFTGAGLQHSGSGNLTIKGNLTINNEEDSKCLQALRTTDPRDDKYRIEMEKGGLLHDSYIWVLDNHDFKQWYNDTENRLLWIKGDPGKGKTMLLCGIINELRNQEAGILISYFFCQATDLRINNATAVLRGLIYMLIVQQPKLIWHVREKYDKAGEQLFKDVNAWAALSTIFTSILQDPSIHNAYVIIDALDECITDRDLLLDLIVQKSVVHSSVKWIVSSRNWTSIEEHLDIGTKNLRLSLELNEKSVSAAVGIYVQHKVSELTRLKKYDTETRDAVQHHLQSNAADTFLWVALVCKELRKTLRRHTLSKLAGFPPGLDELYKRMIDQIRDSEDSELCKSILAVISVVYQPITLDELASFVEESSEEVIALCGSFLTLRERTISFVHQSAKDFLVKNATVDIFPSGIKDIHYDIFSRSLQVMSKILRRDIYGLGAPGSPIEQVIQPNPDPLAPARYSCVYWVDHLYDYTYTNKTSNDLQDGGSVDKFLRQKYLYWLEAISLLKGISNGVVAMVKLDRLLQGQISQLAKFVQDGCRFIQYHKYGIENAPLQVYASALIFSPAFSITRNQFRYEEPEWIIRKPAVQDDWNECLQTLEGHTGPVLSVAFSPDGKLVASGAGDLTVRLWSSETGALQRTLEGHAYAVNSVAFSLDGKLVASASDENVRIWSSETGALERTLEGHTRFTTLVTFSPNGKLVASASQDQTVRLWSIETCALQRTLEGHTDLVSSVAFSPDSKLVASASWDQTVRFWSIETGALQRMLGGHSNSVKSVAFSPNGKLVASTSDDKTIRLWSSETGALQRTLEGHTGFVKSVVLSPDSKLVASASWDRTVRLWTSETGALQRTLEGHTNLVSSVAFSPDSKLVASAYQDRTVRLWRSETGALQRTLEGHTNLISLVTFSPDGKLVATASQDQTVRLWTSETGALQRTLEGHTGFVSPVAFSPDSKLVASASQDDKVRLWSSETGALQRTLEGHTGYVTSVAFSPNGKLVASGSDDRRVRLWSSETGALQRTLKGHTRYVTAVAFSPNGKLVASAARDQTVRLWSIETGVLQRTLEGHTIFVSAVAFSPDSKLVAAALDHATVRIWWSETGDYLQTVKLGTDSQHIVFSQEGLSYYLHTDSGVISLDSLLALANGANAAVEGSSSMSSAPPLPNHQNRRLGYGLSEDRCWITLKGRNLVWLPADARPKSSAVSGSTVVIGCGSGRVVFIRLRAEGPPEF